MLQRNDNAQPKWQCSWATTDCKTIRGCLLFSIWWDFWPAPWLASPLYRTHSDVFLSRRHAAPATDRERPNQFLDLCWLLPISLKAFLDNLPNQKLTCHNNIIITSSSINTYIGGSINTYIGTSQEWRSVWSSRHVSKRPETSITRDFIDSVLFLFT